MICTFCRAAITERKIHFRDECPGCGRDLHICLNCEFYDRSAYRQCRESAREPVNDKDRANLCDFFRPGKTGADAVGADNEARRKLNDLFK